MRFFYDYGLLHDIMIIWQTATTSAMLQKLSKAERLSNDSHKKVDNNKFYFCTSSMHKEELEVVNLSRSINHI